MYLLFVPITHETPKFSQQDGNASTCPAITPGPERASEKSKLFVILVTNSINQGRRTEDVIPNHAAVDDDGLASAIPVRPAAAASGPSSATEVIPKPIQRAAAVSGTTTTAT
jgi:hypothetical protein